MTFQEWYKLNQCELLSQFIRDNIQLVSKCICEMANEETVKAYGDFVLKEYEKSK